MFIAPGDLILDPLDDRKFERHYYPVVETHSVGGITIVKVEALGGEIKTFSEEFLIANDYLIIKKEDIGHGRPNYKSKA